MFVNCHKKPKLHNCKYGPRNNDPVNMQLVERISKSRKRYYPDNEGIPVIEFYRNGKEFYHWMFEKEEENLRDDVFEWLLNTPAPKPAERIEE